MAVSSERLSLIREVDICGIGGSAGLTLARLFQPLTNKIDCVVFERDEHQTVGQQGGSLDLHADYGQRALREAGLFEKFQELAGYDGEALRIIDCFGNVIFDSSQNERPADIRNRPEIDRESLRELLLDSVDPRIIRWGCKIVKVQLGADGQYDVVLSDRIEFGFDVVVGADGAWSKVQPLISSVSSLQSPKSHRFDIIARWQPLESWFSEHPALILLNNRNSALSVGREGNAQGSNIDRRTGNAVLCWHQWCANGNSAFASAACASLEADRTRELLRPRREEIDCRSILRPRGGSDIRLAARKGELA